MPRLPVHNPTECGKLDNLTIPDEPRTWAPLWMVMAGYAVYSACLAGAVLLLVWALQLGD